ncbi:MAG: hypothetical protein H7Y00_09035 [Fimbriimonadaceae bacterium]|nr:hypothetical protein [Chitinophagales bacterium]
MKKLFLILTLTISVLAVSAQTGTENSIGRDQTSIDQQMQNGVIMLKADSWIIRVSENGESTDYFPSNLTDEFKVENLRVVFSGEVQDIPANVRMVGKPIRLTSIKKV